MSYSSLITYAGPGSDGAGSYGIETVTGTMAAGLAANAEIVQFRWTSATALCSVEEISMWAGSIGAFTAGFFRFRVVPARGWTAAGTGGGTATLTGNNAKLQTVKATTAVSQIRTATTIALGAGTKTLDSQGVGSIGGSVPNVAGDPLISPKGVLFSACPLQPLVLAANEGFVILATVPATGTFTAGFNFRWSEVGL